MTNQPGTQPDTARFPIGLILGLGVGMLIGGGLIYLSVVDVTSELKLRSGEAVVQADVLDTRVMENRKIGVTHEVLYEFTLPGDPQKYTLGDATGRDGLWTAVPEEDWHTARAAKKLAVRYLPSDPRVSRPVNAEFSPLGDLIAGLVLGLFILLPCLYLLVRVLLGAKAPPSDGVRAPERAGPHSAR